MARILAFLTVFLLICRSEMSPTSSISCEYVDWDFITCVRYLGGYESDPPMHCCEAVVQLNSEPKQDSKAICQCIQEMAKDLGIQFDVSRIEALPRKCRRSITFPISDGSMNCSKIQ